MKLYTAILCFMCTYCVFEAKAQVVNIEAERIRTDTAGWAGNAAATFHIYKNNYVLYDLNSSIHVQYKTKRSLILLINNIDFISVDYPSGDDVPFENAGLQHLRYNYKFTDRFVGEAFVQGQYNEALGIDWRFLTGVGPRYKLIGNDKFRMYAAALYMFEKEQDNDDTPLQTNNRMSDYISFTYNFATNSSLVSTTYYQPILNDFSDYRISSQVELQFNIWKSIYFTTSYSIIYDTNPAVAVDKTVYSLDNGLKFKF